MYFSNTFLSVNSNTNIMWNRKDMWSWKGSTPAGHLANMYRESPWLDNHNYQGYLSYFYNALPCYESQKLKFRLLNQGWSYSLWSSPPPSSYLLPARSSGQLHLLWWGFSGKNIFIYLGKIFPYLRGAGLHWWRVLRGTDGCSEPLVLWEMWSERCLRRRRERSSQCTWVSLFVHTQFWSLQVWGP